jgi:hypothetical protein
MGIAVFVLVGVCVQDLYTYINIWINIWLTDCRLLGCTQEKDPFAAADAADEYEQQDEVSQRHTQTACTYVYLLYIYTYVYTYNI